MAAVAPDRIGTTAARIALGPGSQLDAMLGGGLGGGALHEIVAARPGDMAAALGFAWALAARVAGARGIVAPVVWILERQAEYEGGTLYAPGLALHGLDPARVILVRTSDARQSLWAMEEALKCRAPAAVVGEVWGLARLYDLAASRRLVLAAARSGTPGLLLAAGMAGQAAAMSSGAQTRFEIRAGPSRHLSSAGQWLPQPGRPVWRVRIAKARLGAGSVAVDREQVISVFWDGERGCFRDALSRSMDALPAARAHPATAAAGAAQPVARRASR